VVAAAGGRVVGRCGLGEAAVERTEFVAVGVGWTRSVGEAGRIERTADGRVEGGVGGRVEDDSDDSVDLMIVFAGWILLAVLVIVGFTAVTLVDPLTRVLGFVDEAVVVNPAVLLLDSAGPFKLLPEPLSSLSAAELVSALSSAADVSEPPTPAIPDLLGHVMELPDEPFWVVEPDKPEPFSVALTDELEESSLVAPPDEPNLRGSGRLRSPDAFPVPVASPILVVPSVPSASSISSL